METSKNYLRKALILFIAYIPLTAFAGVGSGGGGSSLTSDIKARFWEVIERVEQKLTNADGISGDQIRDLKSFISDSKKFLKNSAFNAVSVSHLRYCDTGDIVRETFYDAWGCVGKLQIKAKSFDMTNDALIFHELSRVVPGYMHFDEDYVLSVNTLRLNSKQQSVVITKEIYPKERYRRYDVETEKNLREKAGAIGTKIIESNGNFTLQTIWTVFGTEYKETIFNR